MKTLMPVENLEHSRTEEKPQPIQEAVKRPNQRRCARPLQLPRDLLAFTLQKCRHASGLSLYRVAERSGVDYAHVWRIEQGEHQNVSREILILLSIALVVETGAVDQIIEVANEILDAAGLKMLRAPWESSLSHSRDNAQPIRLRDENGTS